MVLKHLQKKENEVENTKVRESVSEKTVVKVKKIPTEIYSRVVGYYRPVSNWNEGKREEFKDRKEFRL